jgi:hypothetical protein
MTRTVTAAPESHRLEALIRQRVGWQVDDLQVLVDERGLILHGHARSGLGRQLAQTEAARLSGLPVIENAIVVG